MSFRNILKAGICTSMILSAVVPQNIYAQHTDNKVSILLSEESRSSNWYRLVEQGAKKLGIQLEPEFVSGDEVKKDIILGKLAAGEMTDLCEYNSGSLLKGLYPEEYFMDLSEESFIDDLAPIFRDAVTMNGAVYGVPSSYSCGAGIVLYNTRLYEKYGLSVPETWEEFIGNCEALKEKGFYGVAGGFLQSWSSQVCLLADYYNVLQEIPDFAERFAEGKIRFTEDETALRSWEKCEDLSRFYNSNMFSSSIKQACDMFMNGSCGHYIILSSESLEYIAEKYPYGAKEIRAFAIPGDKAGDTGVTLWPANALYINKNSRNKENARKVLQMVMSAEFIGDCLDAIPPIGPLTVNNVEFTEDTMQAVKDIQKYIDNGKYCTALEFQTDFKGENCEYYTGLVAAGKMSAKEGALAYDQSCEKAALLLGLNWES